MVTAFLQEIQEQTEAHAYSQLLVNYRSPQWHSEGDRSQKIHHARSYLAWDREEYAMLFYLMWSDSHWRTTTVAEVLIFQMRTQIMDQIATRASARSILSNREGMRPPGFMEFYQDE